MPIKTQSKKQGAKARRVARAAAPMKAARDGRSIKNGSKTRTTAKGKTDDRLLAELRKLVRARRAKAAGSGGKISNGSQTRSTATHPTSAPAGVSQPRYDQGLLYGTPGLKYPVTVVPTPENDGAKVALNLRTKSDSDLLVYTDNHIALIGADPLFSGLTLMPSTAEFLALRNEYATALAAFNAAKDTFHAATRAKDSTRLALEVGFNVRGPYVQSVANFNAQAILATGLSLKAPPSPPPVLQPPENLRIDLNGTVGVMFASWLAVSGARGYLIQFSLADTDERNWSEPQNSTNRKVTFTGMLVGHKYAFRVATIGADSTQSLWSAEVLRMAA